MLAEPLAACPAPQVHFVDCEADSVQAAPTTLESLSCASLAPGGQALLAGARRDGTVLVASCEGAVRALSSNKFDCHVSAVALSADCRWGGRAGSGGGGACRGDACAAASCGPVAAPTGPAHPPCRVVAVCGYERKGQAGAVYIWQHEAPLGREQEAASRPGSPDNTVLGAASAL